MVQLWHGRRLPSLLHACRRYSSRSTGPATGLLKGQILPYLYNRFYDLEAFIDFGMKLKSWKVEAKNNHYLKIQKKYGNEMAAAAFALMLKGGVRFQGQTEWYREHNIKRYRVDLARYLRFPLEAIDFSDSIINYDGLGCLVHLKALKHLNLSRCPNVDDWCLSRLHVFGDTLEELSLAGCPRITERGLGCLHHLESLRRLDVSDLPSVPYKGLVRILLEEMLPQCEVVGIHYDEELALPTEPNAHQGQIEEPQGAAYIPKTRESPA
ncbi:distal membrane-arm assembly complex protein 2 isoform X2 [Heteronotia binoei]|uniref:distal membrane-arm assembly complex protein 2 isoform X2 n=1 Tax=Heteronotia binoei TaxID=13085 RepID=UPI00292DCA05|nr:distal membrane-arm assembly complex protein 2 isoform X2 [Heteronotia binoei]